MIIKKNKSDGFILITVLILIVVLAMICQRFATNLMSSSVSSKTNIVKQQARILAINGVSLALCELYNAEHEKTKRSQEAKLDDKPLNKLYDYLLPQHNLWKEYRLEQQTDGIEAYIKNSISSEDGKINLNNIYDPKKKAIKEEYIKFLDKFYYTSGEKKDEKLSLFLNKFFSKRKDEFIQDPSEIELDKKFKLFYTPPPLPEEKNIVKDKKIAICDIFTVFGSKGGTNPMLLSNSIRKALGFKKQKYTDAKELKEDFKTLAKELSPSWAKEWGKNLDSIEQIYSGKNREKKVKVKKSNDSKKEKASGNKSEKEDAKGLESILNLLSKEIEPKFFTIRSRATYKDWTQEILAIVKREKLENEKNNDREKKDKRWSDRQSFVVPPGYSIVRIYDCID